MLNINIHIIIATALIVNLGPCTSQGLAATQLCLNPYGRQSIVLDEKLLSKMLTSSGDGGWRLW